MSFSIRPLTVADFPRIVAIVNSQEIEPMTLEEMERSERLRPAEMPIIRMGTFDEAGVMVAYGIASTNPEMPKGCFNTRVRVDKPYRHQGAGAQLYVALEDWARERGATRLESTVKDNQPESLAWAERRGWAKEHHLFESTLRLENWEPAPEFLKVRDEALAKGFRFSTLADEVPADQVIRSFYDLLAVMMRDVPVFGERPLPPYDLFEKYVAADPKFDARNIILAVHEGKFAAMCSLDKMESGGLYHGLTAVDREYRGHGLATAIKVVALEHARRLGAPYVRTNNHSANERMLAVNRKFGYVPAPGFFTVAKTFR